MNKLRDSAEFWNSLDTLIKTCEIVIDRPKGSRHPRFPDFIYPLNYGYLEGTTSMDNGGIDVWIGTSNSQRVDAILCIVDMWKKDSEIKLLYSCTAEEKQRLYRVNNAGGMHGILIEREAPSHQETGMSTATGNDLCAYLLQAQADR